MNLARFFLFFVVTAFAHGQGQSLLYTVPFKAGDEGAKIYRIPAIWWLPKKPLMAFAERRMEQRRMFGDVDIVLRRSLDHGETWQIGADAADHTSEPQVIEMDRHTLLMNARTISGHGSTRTLIVSKDRGTTWQPAQEMAALVENNCQGCIYKCFRNDSNGQYDWILVIRSVQGAQESTHGSAMTKASPGPPRRCSGAAPVPTPA